MAGMHMIRGGEFTLDLNGNKITQPSGTAISITGGSVTITDTGSGGTIEASTDAIYVEGGDLFITGEPVIYGNSTGVTVKDGSVKIEDGDITGYGIAAVDTSETSCLSAKIQKIFSNGSLSRINMG